MNKNDIKRLSRVQELTQVLDALNVKYNVTMRNELNEVTNEDCVWDETLVESQINGTICYFITFEDATHVAIGNRFRGNSYGHFEYWLPQTRETIEDMSVTDILKVLLERGLINKD